MINKTLAAIVSLMMLMTLAMSTNAQAQVAPKYGGTLVVAIDGDPPHLNLALTSSSPAGAGGPVFNALIQNDFDYKPRPDLAQSWTISPDGLTYTFNLARNVTWHDGNPFTSADVKFSIEKVLRPYHPMGYSYDCINTIDTPDPYTVIFKLKYPYGPLLNMLDLRVGTMLPKHLLDGKDVLNDPFNSAPVGTGPFKFVEWVKGSHVTVKRNDKYWKAGRPYLDKIVFKIIPDPSVMAMALEKGEIDCISASYIAFSEWDRLFKLPNVDVVFHGDEEALSIRMLTFNLKHPILSKLDVRKGIAYAIDKEELNKKGLFSYGVVSTGPIPTFIKWCYNPDVTKYNRDLKKANDLLDKAGYPRGSDGTRFELECTFQPSYWDCAKFAEIIRSQLADVGIKFNLLPLERAAFFDKTYVRKQFDTFVHRFSSGSDPQITVARLYVSTNIKPVSLTNGAQYINPRVDELFEKGASAVTLQERAKYYYEMQQIIVDELPVLHLAEANRPNISKKEFANLPDSPHSDAENYERAWWRNGVELSPQAITKLIEDKGKELDSLRGQLYDVTQAVARLNAAKEALNAGDYRNALKLAGEATSLAQPPYMLYTGIVVLVAVACVALYWYRRKGARPKT